MFDMLINNDNKLPEDYIPNDLIITDDNENNFHNYKNPSLKPSISKVILKDFKKMKNDALLNGYNIIVDSGYRSYEYQKEIWDHWVATKGYEYASSHVAMPGASEHQSGLAIDVAYFKNGIYHDDIKGNEEELQWLFNNSYKYGFILRYPKGKEEITKIDYEPWHFRYVGKNLALELYTNNLTLEEYHNKRI